MTLKVHKTLISFIPPLWPFHLPLLGVVELGRGIFDTATNHDLSWQAEPLKYMQDKHYKLLYIFNTKRAVHNGSSALRSVSVQTR